MILWTTDVCRGAGKVQNVAIQSQSNVFFLDKQYFSRYPNFTIQTKWTVFFRLAEYAMFLQMSPNFSIETKESFVLGYAIFLLISKYYHEPQSNFSV